MNHPWKLAFWSCLFLLVLLAGFSFYSILDQGVTLTHLRDDYSKKEKELETLTEMLDSAPIRKQQVVDVLEEHLGYEIPDAGSDTIGLSNLTYIFIFKNDTLLRLIKKP